MRIEKQTIKSTLITEDTEIKIDKHVARSGEYWPDVAYMVDVVQKGRLFHRRAFHTYDEALNEYADYMDVLAKL